MWVPVRFLRRVDQEVETALASRRLDAFQHGGEEGTTDLGDEQTKRIGPAAGENARGGMGHIVEGINSEADAFRRLLGDRAGAREYYQRSYETGVYIYGEFGIRTEDFEARMSKAAAALGDKGDPLRERADELPPSLKLSMLTGHYLSRRHGGLYYARAQNMNLRLRVAYDDALSR